MKLQRMHVRNFRGLNDVELVLSSFGCLIGENNAGKSSALHALGLVIPGSGFRLAASDFYDQTADVEIQLDISEIQEADYKRIPDPTARQRLKELEKDGKLSFVRVGRIEGEKVSAPQIQLIEHLPRDARLRPDKIGEAVTGRGAELRENVIRQYPELASSLSPKPTQPAAREAIQTLIRELGPQDFVEVPVPVKSGLEASIKAFLPEVIYIPAVKDVADEIKTADTATFGKLLGLLLATVREQFADMEEDFRAIHRRMSRVFGADGEIVDDRDPEFKHIEHLINGFVSESFPATNLRITVPTPELKALFASAQLTADDGHEGGVVTKGDGLKRSVAFAILRAYMQLKLDGFPERASKVSEGDVPEAAYLLLFEEPELYLHPQAQRQLFRALEEFSKSHHVLVTTHSPLFLNALKTQGFTKMTKVSTGDGHPPVSKPTRIDLSDVNARDAFQIICHENNEIAFFARTVVLVEGDSDAIVLPHLARLINPNWDVMAQGIAFARTNGKSNIARYRKFFERFDVRVHVIADLDSLRRGFNELQPTPGQAKLQSRLMSLIDSHLGDEQPLELSRDDIKRIGDSTDIANLWSAAQQQFQNWDRSLESAQSVVDAVDHFFAGTRKADRSRVLASDLADVAALREQLADSLAMNDTYVLRRGAIESYYPYSGTTGSERKLREALSFCDSVPDLNSYRTSSVTDVEDAIREISAIMARIFATEDSPNVAAALPQVLPSAA